jgi:hypothetical protein
MVIVMSKVVVAIRASHVLVPVCLCSMGTGRG